MHFSADFLEFRNKTIPQIKELIHNYILSLNVPGKNAYSKSFFNSIFNIQTFISLWNKEDTTSLVNDGIRWVFSNYIYSSNYFKLKLDSYGSENHNRDCYEIIYTNGTWSKIRRIITTNSDDNNKELVNIEGDLIVTETINGFSFLNNAIVNNTNITSVIYGSDSTWKGPALWLTKYNASTNNGYFDLIAQNNNLAAHLAGTPDGTLTWNNNDLAGIAIVAKNINTNGYIHFSCDFILQWVSGHASYATASEGSQVYISQFISPLSNVRSYGSSLDVIDSSHALIAIAYNDTNQNRYIRILAATDVTSSYMEYSYFMFGVIVH